VRFPFLHSLFDPYDVTDRHIWRSFFGRQLFRIRTSLAKLGPRSRYSYGGQNHYLDWYLLNFLVVAFCLFALKKYIIPIVGKLTVAFVTMSVFG
jgi:hypothetical protein